MASLFTPIQIGKGRLHLKNRIQVAPAAPFLSGHNGENTSEFMEYTRQLALSGAGLVTLGMATTDPQAFGFRVLNASSPFNVIDLSEITEMIHESGAAASIELAYAKYMLGPADAVVNNSSAEEIRQAIDTYVQSAVNCMRAGFDMIMIHGGHGNVPARFFSGAINHRSDEYGGSLINRARFATEMLEKIREAVGQAVAIEYRISAEELIPSGTGLEETKEFVKLIEDKIDLLHVSRGLLLEDSTLPYVFQPTYFPRAMNLKSAKELKKSVGIPVSVVGSFDLETAERAVSNGDVDIVAMIRNVIAGGKDSVHNACVGKAAETRPCIRCNTCIDRTHSRFLAVRCAVNPTVGRETQVRLGVSPTRKSVMLIGGGPANLEAARAASKAGLDVRLYEKTDVLGGLLKTAVSIPFKSDLKKYLNWSVKQVEKDSNIAIQMNTIVTPDVVRQEKPDILVVGIGGSPVMLSHTTQIKNRVTWAGEIESGRIKPGNTVLIAGAGFTGLELALHLSRQGKNILVVESQSEKTVTMRNVAISMIGIKQLLHDAGVTIRYNTSLMDVTDSYATLKESNNEIEHYECDTVVYALGVQPDREQISMFSDLCPKTYVVGDCNPVHGCTLWNATTTGYDAIMRALT